MRASRGFLGLLLALLVGACGRFGVELLSDGSARFLPDSSGDSPDSDVDGGDDADAGELDTGLLYNPPFDRDAGPARDALVPNVPVDAATADAGGSSGSDAGAQDAGTRDAGVDAGGRDAGTDAGVDAGTDAGVSPCAGQSVFGLCWYLAAFDTSCNEECSTRGGFDTRARSYIGTSSQGGSLAECTQILTALGRPGTVGEAMRADNFTFGCHVWTDDARWWLSTGPALDPSTAAAEVRMACACTR